MVIRKFDYYTFTLVFGIVNDYTHFAFVGGFNRFGSFKGGYGRENRFGGGPRRSFGGDRRSGDFGNSSFGERTHKKFSGKYQCVLSLRVFQHGLLQCDCRLIDCRSSVKTSTIVQCLQFLMGGYISLLSRYAMSDI